MMTKILTSIVLAVALLTGCVTKSPSNSNPVTEAQRIDRLALVLKTTVSGVVTLAADDRKQQTRDHIILARNILAALVSKDQTSPEDVVAALTPLLQQAKPEVRLAVTTAFGILDAYYHDYVFDVTNGNENAKKFLTAVVDGIDAGLAMSPPVNP